MKRATLHSVRIPVVIGPSNKKTGGKKLFAGKINIKPTRKVRSFADKQLIKNLFAFYGTPEKLRGRILGVFSEIAGTTRAWGNIITPEQYILGVSVLCREAKAGANNTLKAMAQKTVHEGKANGKKGLSAPTLAKINRQLGIIPQKRINEVAAEAKKRKPITK